MCSSIFQEVKELITTKQVAEYEGIALNKKGKIFLGLCPFHSEKTPSFTVYENGGFKCFGCGVSGADGIALKAKLRNLKPLEACKAIIEDFHLPVTAPQASKGTKLKQSNPIFLDGDFIRGMKEWSRKTFIILCDTLHLVEKLLKTYTPDTADDLFYALVALKGDLDTWTDILIKDDIEEVFNLRLKLQDLLKKGEDES